MSQQISSPSILSLSTLPSKSSETPAPKKSPGFFQSLFSKKVPPAPRMESLSAEGRETLAEALVLRHNGNHVYTDRDFICSPRWFAAIKSSVFLQGLAESEHRDILLKAISV
jgi:hypothetical protein